MKVLTQRAKQIKRGRPLTKANSRETASVTNSLTETIRDQKPKTSGLSVIESVKKAKKRINLNKYGSDRWVIQNGNVVVSGPRLAKKADEVPSRSITPDHDENQYSVVKTRKKKKNANKAINDIHKSENKEPNSQIKKPKAILRTSSAALKIQNPQLHSHDILGRFGFLRFRGMFLGVLTKYFYNKFRCSVSN